VLRKSRLCAEDAAGAPLARDAVAYRDAHGLAAGDCRELPAAARRASGGCGHSGERPFRRLTTELSGRRRAQRDWYPRAKLLGAALERLVRRHRVTEALPPRRCRKGTSPFTPLQDYEAPAPCAWVLFQEVGLAQRAWRRIGSQHPLFPILRSRAILLPRGARYAV
jgi:hypothetical protein